MKSIRFAVASVIALGLARGAASAAILTVPSAANPTIQMAVDHAAANDTISILAGEYRENVTIPNNKPGLTIVGQLAYGGVCPSTPSVIVDGCVNGSCARDAFDVAASRTSFRCMEIRNGSIGIHADSNASYLTVFQVSFVHTGSYGVEVEGGGYKILYNTFAGTDGAAIFADAGDGQISHNTVKQAKGTCIHAEGDRVIVDFNTLSLCDGDAIYVDGSNANLNNNTIESVEAYGVDISGCNATVSNNKTLQTYGYGVYVECTTANQPTSVLNNQVDTTGDQEGIYVTGDYALVKGNTVKNTGYDESCFDINGDYGRFEGNTALNCGLSGFYIDGLNPVVLSNKADKQNYGGYGIELIASTGSTSLRVEGNVTSGSNDDSGFNIEAIDPTTVVGNVAGNSTSGNIGYGFDIFLSNSTITGNTAANNGGFRDAGIYIDGDNNVIKQNAANGNADTGIEIYGCMNQLSYNQSRSNLGDGFVIDQHYPACAVGNTVDHSTLQFNQAEGFEIYDSTTILNFNNSTGNRKKGGSPTVRSGDCTNDSGAPLTLLGNVCADGSNFTVPSEAD